MHPERYRVGIVGLGNIAVRTADKPAQPPLRDPVLMSHVASISYLPNMELVAVCDVVPEMVERFRTLWSARWPNTRRYTDYREMLAKEKLDILTVATPEHLHRDVTVLAAKTGLKAIFCEKPLATSLEDADAMIEACEANKVVLTVGYTRRWAPLYHTVRDALRSGAIGPLGTVYTSFGGPQAWLFRNGTHLLDAICFFAESEPVKAFAHLEEGFDDWDTFKGEGGIKTVRDPGLTGYVQFANGVRGLYSSHKTMSNGIREVVLDGPKGQISFQLEDPMARLKTPTQTLPWFAESMLVPPRYKTIGIEAVYAELIDSIENGTESVCTAREARKTVQIMMAFLQSHQEGGRLVKVPG
ncbi:MAG: Gfo/Idh/MocA family oxidoreductase [SAR202 cluster bacterium]|nr:Gfo/Idh/MocA family oxidoreductase [SAR202 cluster bacterium]